MILNLIAVNTYYSDLVRNKDLILHYKENFEYVYIWTDRFVECKKLFTNSNIVVKEYVKTLKNSIYYFNYFDKLYTTLNLSEEFNKPVVYSDIRSLHTIKNYNYNVSTPGVYYPRVWGGDAANADMLRTFTGEAFEDRYWLEFLEYLNTKNIEAKLIPTLFEQTLLITPSIDIKKIITYLKEIEKLFISLSITKKHKYQGIGNGEGLALGYACVCSGVSMIKFSSKKLI